jgi:putative flippase GtrA
MAAVKPPERIGSVGRFVISGALSALVSWSVCVGLLQFGTSASLAGSGAYLASIPVGFVLHRLFSFGSTNPWGGDAGRFVVVSASSACLAGAGLAFAMHTLGLRFELSVALMVVLVAPFNYGAMKLWVFFKPKQRA